MSAEDDWTGSLAAGALGVLTLFLAAGAALSLLPSALAIPIALASAAVTVIAKVFGMAALFLLLGQKLLKSVAPARRPAALAAGFVVLGGLSLVPLVGALVWSAASIVAVDAAPVAVRHSSLPHCDRLSVVAHRSAVSGKPNRPQFTAHGYRLSTISYRVPPWKSAASEWSARGRWAAASPTSRPGGLRGRAARPRRAVSCGRASTHREEPAPGRRQGKDDRVGEGPGALGRSAATTRLEDLRRVRRRRRGVVENKDVKIELFTKLDRICRRSDPRVEHVLDLAHAHRGGDEAPRAASSGCTS